MVKFNQDKNKVTGEQVMYERTILDPLQEGNILRQEL